MAEDVQSGLPARRLEKAYEAVFGQPESRTSDQRLVYADLERHCYVYRLVSEGRVDGDVATARALFNDGRRSVWLRIRGQILKALTNPKPVTVSRKKGSNP